MLAPMTQPDLSQIKAAVAQDPRNAELRYLLGAEPPHGYELQTPPPEPPPGS